METRRTGQETEKKKTKKNQHYTQQNRRRCPLTHTKVSPGIQDALILRQLSHETWIRPRDASLLLDKVVGFV